MKEFFIEIVQSLKQIFEFLYSEIKQLKKNIFDKKGV
jgi:hypothetical protein|tara:strand:+ start:465 stop:575 length:111 start_codon:yes stop_codon:yes gene_type:complete